MVIITVPESVKTGQILEIRIRNPDNTIAALGIQTWVQNSEGELGIHALGYKTIRLDPSESRKIPIDIPERLSIFSGIKPKLAQIVITVSDTAQPANTPEAKPQSVFVKIQEEK